MGRLVRGWEGTRGMEGWGCKEEVRRHNRQWKGGRDGWGNLRHVGEITRAIKGVGEALRVKEKKRGGAGYQTRAGNGRGRTETAKGKRGRDGEVWRCRGMDLQATKEPGLVGEGKGERGEAERMLGNAKKEVLVRLRAFGRVVSRLRGITED